MSSPVSPSPHGFVVVRGRGYLPEQVEHRAAELSKDRDDAWERAARLTVLAKEMEAGAAALGERVQALPPQTYETLSDRARYLLAVVQEEDAELRASVRDEAQAEHEAAESAAQAARAAAREYAEAVRADAEARGQEVLLAAQEAADEARAGARGEATQWREEAVATLTDTRERAAGVVAAQEKDHAERWEASGHEIVARETRLEARHAELTAHAEASLAEAKRLLADTEEASRHGQEDAEARGAELIAQARVLEERVVRETERILREHDESREEMQAHMDHVRSSLASLTGRSPTGG